ncbi:SCO0930 family lipoprotein [Spirillospora sp. CA-294931]|uniref:SCO0930 family lipoprotein n=1 Tax=Spirillospora sp. CA-294931 TaxID=3240042 RepID=UPI003D928248
MEFPKWAIPVAAALTASGVLLTACGQETAGKQKNTAAGSKQVAEGQQDAGAEPQQQQQESVQTASLEVANVEKLGKVVTDGEGRTLYRFDKDTARPPASTCMGACATAWPPVWANNEDPQVKGVDQNLVGKVKRPDGKWQVTLGGWPMYRYAKDQSPGDVKGQGVQGTWYASAPDGKKAGGGAAAQEEPRADGGQEEGGGRWAGWTVLKVRQDAKLGMIVTDGKGRTLYRFDKDRPKVTNCFGACKAAWPPVDFTSWKKLKVEGIDRSKVKFIERKDDGKCQVTINGWPMYYFAKDQQAGDTKGQGVQNVWWVVSPEGKKITTGAGGDSGNGGYGNDSGGGGDSGGGYGGGGY